MEREDEAFPLDTTDVVWTFTEGNRVKLLNNADTKYTFLNKRVSPFVSARVGGVFNTEYKMNRMLINPMAGIDVRHFSVGLGYELQHAFKGVIENKASMHNVHLRVGYTF